VWWVWGGVSLKSFKGAEGDIKGNKPRGFVFKSLCNHVIPSDVISLEDETLFIGPSLLDIKSRVIIHSPICTPFLISQGA
jgi:hypothetical protein